MASSSASEFLTLYRTLATRVSRGPAVARSRKSQPFSTSSTRTNKDIGPNRTHVLEKGNDTTNVQSKASLQGRDAKDKNTGGNATQEQDSHKSASKAKEEFPEAPDTVIGMQDERGGKGH